MDVVMFNQSNTILTPEQDLILIDFFGYGSGVLVGVTLLPQVIKVFKTKSTKDLSYIFLGLSLLAAAFKFIYGILINQLPIVVTAPIIGVKTIVIIIAKCIFDKRIDKLDDKEQPQIELAERVKNDEDIVAKLKNLIEHNDIDSEIKYKNNDVDMIISKNKITINTIELDFQTSIIRNIFDFVSRDIL